MLPLFSDGDRLLIWHCQRPQNGDVIVFRDARSAELNRPESKNQPRVFQYRNYLKRVTALPGETVQCWDMPYQLSDSEYYVLGDNAAASTDSRTFGPISRDCIIGIVILKYFPSISWARRLRFPL